MQDDCLDVSNKPFYKRRKNFIPPTRGASFRAPKITLMLTRAYNYYGGAAITVRGIGTGSDCQPHLDLLIIRTYRIGSTRNDSVSVLETAHVAA